MQNNLSNKKLFLFDIDGVIKVGDVLIDGAIDLFNYINSIGGKSIFITNNSTKGCKAYVDYFTNLGFSVDESNFITALSVSVSYLKTHHQNDKIFVLGTQSLYNELIKNGLNATNEVEPNIKVVLVGYDNELTYKKMADACKVLQTQNVVYLATNSDLKCPVDFGFIPDCGAITDMIKTTTGKQPKFLGKPAPDMVLQSLQNTGFSKQQTLVIGDRLYTDIACGNNAGVDTCVVFTGEAQPQDIAGSQYLVQYQFNSVKQLLQAIKNSK